MSTLLDLHWHRGQSQSSREEELAHWGATPFLLLLICTGTTIKEEKLTDWMARNSQLIPENRFFCILDNEDNELASEVWGEDFSVLADAIKRTSSAVDKDRPGQKNYRKRGSEALARSERG
jgi:hypothetical protein